MIIDFISTKESCTLNVTLKDFWYEDSIFNKRVYLRAVDEDRSTVKVSSNAEGRQIVKELTTYFKANKSDVSIDSSNIKPKGTK